MESDLRAAASQAQFAGENGANLLYICVAHQLGCGLQQTLCVHARVGVVGECAVAYGHALQQRSLIVVQLSQYAVEHVRERRTHVRGRHVMGLHVLVFITIDPTACARCGNHRPRVPIRARGYGIAGSGTGR